MTHLTDLPVLAVDCQTTGASPQRGHLLEIAWCRTRASDEHPPEVASFVVDLPDGAQIPRRIRRMTGLDDTALADAVSPAQAWIRLCEQAADTPTAVIHYARFERAFLQQLHRQFGPPGQFPLDIVCTHAIAQRLFADLPRRGLRALAGYLGHTLPEQKRAGPHVAATAWIWSHIIRDLRLNCRIDTLGQLRQWLDETTGSRGNGTRYALDRDRRLALPNTPGIYRMLSKNDDVLYVGKATSLKQRVNTYFQTRRGLAEHKLELVTQVWDVEVTTAATPLEAALLETDEIKRRDPPYNRALRPGRGRLRFTNPGWTSFIATPDRTHRVGPLRSTRPLRVTSALDDTAALTNWLQTQPADRLTNAIDYLAEGVAVFDQRHHGKSRDSVALDLWWAHCAKRDTDRDGGSEPLSDPPWTPERVADALESNLRRAHRACRRTRLLCMLTDHTIAWRPPIDSCDGRLIVFEAGQVVRTGRWSGGRLPSPPGFQRTFQQRQELFDRPMWDRLRVLTTEIRRLITRGCDVRVRLRPTVEFDAGEVAQWIRLV